MIEPKDMGFYNTLLIFLDNYLVSLVQPNIKQKDKWKKNLTNSHHENILNLSNSVNNNFNDVKTWKIFNPMLIEKPKSIYRFDEKTWKILNFTK